MTNHLLSALTIFFLVLAGCDSDDIFPTQTDWCYIFDFTTNSHQINFVNGSWVSGDGLWPNASGALNANYAQTKMVKPEYLAVTIAPVSGTSGIIDVQANAIIFGVPFALNAPLPANAGEQTIPIPITDPTSQGTTFNFSLQVNQPALVRQLEVRGNGLNPFPMNNCEQESTPTPSQIVPDTLTPTNTPTPTPSDTPTPDLTVTPQTCVVAGQPSPTPDGTPFNPVVTVVANFDDPLPAGFEIRYGTTNPTSGVSGTAGLESVTWTSTGERIDIAFVLPANTVIRSVYWSSLAATSVGGNWETRWLLETSAGVNDGVARNSVSGTGGSALSVKGGAGYDLTGYGVLVQFLFYTGSTNHAGYGGLVDNVTITYEYTSTPTATPWPECTVTPGPTASTVPASSTPHPTGTNIPRTPTASPSPTRTPVVVASPTRTNTPGPTNTTPPILSTATAGPTSTLIPSPTFIPTSSAPVDPEDPGPGDGEWADCDELIGFDLLFLGRYLSQYWECAVVPYFSNILNGITDFFSWVVNTGANIFGWLGGVPGWFGGWLGNVGIQISNIWQLLLALLGMVLSFIVTIIQIVGLVIAIIIHLLFLLAGWIGQFTARAETIITAWTITSPQPIPSLPRCVSSPATSDVCAVWYAAQYTFLSGPIGQLIIPVIVIIVDLIIVMYFIRTVRNLIKKSSEVTS